jgi:hypothetical protein
MIYSSLPWIFCIFTCSSVWRSPQRFTCFVSWAIFCTLDQVEQCNAVRTFTMSEIYRFLVCLASIDESRTICIAYSVCRRSRSSTMKSISLRIPLFKNLPLWLHQA